MNLGYLHIVTCCLNSSSANGDQTGEPLNMDLGSGPLCNQNGHLEGMKSSLCLNVSLNSVK